MGCDGSCSPGECCQDMPGQLDEIRVLLTGHQLQAQFNARATHHDARAAHYAEQASALAKSRADLNQATEPSEEDSIRNAYSSAAPYDPVAAQIESARTSARSHKALAVRFRFFAANIDLSATYSLDTADCTTWELYE